MSAPFLPESAPFSPAQRAWLNGFFAGMASTQPAQGAVMPGMAGSAVTGAAPVGASAPAAPVVEEAEEFPWHDPALSMDERLKLADGKKPERRLMAAMAQLDCGSCGYVCQTYAEAIAKGEEGDLSKCTPGGKETAKWLKQIVKEAPAQVTVKGESVGSVKKADPHPGPLPEYKERGKEGGEKWDRNHPFAARVLVNRKLNRAGSSKDTRLVAFDLRGSGLTYKPGDALGVVPRNCASVVDAILALLGATGAEDVVGADGSVVSLRSVLVEQRSVTRPTEKFFDLLADVATDEGEKLALRKMASGEDAACEDWQVLDVLERFASARPDAVEMARTLSVLQPRLYSISSSLAHCPGQVHLTVGVVKYKNSVGRGCNGVASTYLAERVALGDSVKVFVHPSRSFGLPASGETPVIMVGPGTGVAPFRAFLQERAAAGAKGSNWLFFGDQKSGCDFLFKEEMEAFLKDGVLTKLDVAFSRDQEGKVYVQDRMMEEGKELFEWLEKGAHFYVCGDAKRMASDVDKALRKVVAAFGGMSAEKADAYVSEMVKGGRYQRDVY